ncbi:hypothetical protein [Saccharomonospora glauca]|uniref:Anti-sigma-M factor RsmA n=1 Tax=Saccharomonospora glauca K62 TaxID=928724 RepID=I1D8C7_9PSEU|nr:hypothetical protein [Saccharomonospora glauca]EIF01202.1 hypothetical protein SacglDRAFT_04374 [Saccharomonospora glauca K62]
MTDESRGRGGLVGPPWSVDVLADLHAGVLDEQEAAELWPRVNADPDARAIIEALESTKADLSGFAELDVEPIPADVASRIDAALERERRAGATQPQVTQATQANQAAEAPQPSPQPAAGNANVVSLDAARAKRKKRLGWGAGLLTAAAAVVAAAFLVIPGTGGQEEGVGGTPALAVDSGNLSAAVGEITNVRDYGPLGDEQRLDACLGANGIDPEVKPVGFRPVTIDGTEAVMVLLTTGELGQFRLVALAPDCGPDNPGLLMDETVGGQN